MSSSSGINGVLLCSSLFFVYLCWVLLRVVQKLWLGPIRVQRKMAAQGIRGPPYRFLHGSTKEMFQMRKEAMESSMSLSHDILPKVQPHVYNWISRYGKTHLNWIGPQAELVVAEPEMIREILNNKDKIFTKTETRGFLKQLLGDGLVTSEGAKWAKLRKLANHAFHGESLKSSFPGMIDSVHMMLERWKQNEGREIEVFEEMRLFTSEVISRAAFGSSYIEGRNIFEMLRRLVLFTSRNDSKIRFPGLSKIWKTDDEIEGEKLERGIRSSILAMIKKREEKAAAGEVNGFGDDLLGLLVKALHDEDETKRITLDDLVDECKTFYFAGQETTNSMLTWTIFLLSVHTDWQEAARTEVISTFGRQVPDYDGIAKLKTMTMIIHESLRLYPPVISITRKLDQKAKLGELVLPANMNIFVSNLAVHHDHQIWGEDVHLFKPERFSEGVAKATKNNVAVYLPFGMGPRNCVGMNFATTEARIVLAMILQQYSFTLSPAYVHSPARVLVIQPQHGLQVIVQPPSEEQN